jgi:predicted dehydrogenase
MQQGRQLSRRQFLRSSGSVAALAATAAIIPASVLGNRTRAAASDRITVGCIGIGGQGSGIMGNALGEKGAQVIAVCDVDSGTREKAKARVEKNYSDGTDYKGCSVYNDFRDLLARDDLDAVMIATPDHWHALICCYAAKAGKDIYVEKPMTLTIREAQEMVAVVRRYSRVLQVGSQQRSSQNFRFACELTQNGYIGKVHSVYVNVGPPAIDCDLPAEPVPAGLDWDMWLGPAPWRPYNKKLHPYSWRPYRDFSGYQMTNWGAHHFDIAQWGLGMDGSGPVEITPPDGKEHKTLTYRYATGARMYHMHGDGAKAIKVPTDKGVSGVLFEGDEGWIEVNRGLLRTHPESLLKQQLRPGDKRLYASRGHSQNWFDCIRSRQRTICDVEIGCSSVTVCHLGNIAYWLDRPFKWDPAKQEVVGDEQAARLLDRPKRAPWRL